jgi:hypothetical protein
MSDRKIAGVKVFVSNETYDEYKGTLQEQINNLQSKIDKAIEYIEKSMNNPQPFYEYLFGDENGEVENLDKLLNILKEDK